MEPARLYDKYIGETEKNLDKALRMAEQMAPCVLMIDELEKGLSYNQRRRAQGDFAAHLRKRKRDPKATKPLSVTRAETIGAPREWARDRTVMAS